MTEIAKCACGSKAWLHDEPNRWKFVKCSCGWSGPFEPRVPEAIERWNAVMASIWIPVFEP